MTFGFVELRDIQCRGAKVFFLASCEYDIFTFLFLLQMRFKKTLYVRVSSFHVTARATILYLCDECVAWKSDKDFSIYYRCVVYTGFRQIEFKAGL